MNIYKYPKFAYYIFLVISVYLINAASAISFGLVEYLITLVLPILAIEGITYHFAKTEKEFGVSKKRTFTRIWYLSILLLCAFTVYHINPQDKASTFLWMVLLVIPFLGFTFYMWFFSLVMLFEKKET